VTLLPLPFREPHLGKRGAQFVFNVDLRAGVVFYSAVHVAKPAEIFQYFLNFITPVLMWKILLCGHRILGILRGLS
jgi:hypothetical protein